MRAEPGYLHGLVKCRAMWAVGLARHDPRVKELEDLEDQPTNVGQSIPRDSGAEPERIPAFGNASRKRGEAPLEEVERLGDGDRVGRWPRGSGAHSLLLGGAWAAFLGWIAVVRSLMDSAGPAAASGHRRGSQ